MRLELQSLGQRRESHLKERGPGMELTLSFSSFFCNQVFFVYDPSSSTSLLSSVSSDQGKCERGDGGVDGGVRGPLQELTLGRLTLNRRAHRWQVKPTTGGHASPRPPTNVLLPLCCFAGLLQLCC